VLDEALPAARLQHEFPASFGDSGRPLRILEQGEGGLDEPRRGVLEEDGDFVVENDLVGRNPARENGLPSSHVVEELERGIGASLAHGNDEVGEGQEAGNLGPGAPLQNAGRASSPWGELPHDLATLQRSCPDQYEHHFRYRVDDLRNCPNEHVEALVAGEGSCVQKDPGCAINPERAAQCLHRARLWFCGRGGKDPFGHGMARREGVHPLREPLTADHMGGALDRAALDAAQRTLRPSAPERPARAELLGDRGLHVVDERDAAPPAQRRGQERRLFERVNAIVAVSAQR
jgi:hypothetical protein